MPVSKPDGEAMVAEAEVMMLREAFAQFSTASSGLEESYRTLREEVRRLKEELKMRNRENAALRESAERNRRLAAVGEMAARMAHELRNPLGSIELFAALLGKEAARAAGDPEAADWAAHLSTAVAMMDHAIANLLLFTRKPKPAPRRTDLKATIHEMLGLVTHRLTQQGIARREETAALQPAWCDEDLIRQTLLNLILNALDAMPEGGELRVAASTHLSARTSVAAETVITVSDTGAGIPETLLSRIFDPFFTTKGKGSGLGLAIAHNAVAAHGGRLQVSSRPGRGAAFTIRLPEPSMEPPCGQE